MISPPFSSNNCTIHLLKIGTKKFNRVEQLRELEHGLGSLVVASTPKEEKAMRKGNSENEESKHDSALNPGKHWYSHSLHKRTLPNPTT